MPKFKEEIQFPTMSGVVRPKNGVSLYNYNGTLKLLHADGTVETILTADDQVTQANLSDYYTKEQIDSLISGLNSGSAINGFIIVEELPSSPLQGTIYLVPNNSGTNNNGYTEYLYTGNAWEIVGGTDNNNAQSSSTVMIKDWTVNDNE